MFAIYYYTKYEDGTLGDGSVDPTSEFHAAAYEGEAFSLSKVYQYVLIKRGT
jgi:hypothetical protein